MSAAGEGRERIHRWGTQDINLMFDKGSVKSTMQHRLHRLMRSTGSQGPLRASEMFARRQDAEPRYVPQWFVVIDDSDEPAHLVAEDWLETA